MIFWLFISFLCASVLVGTLYALRGNRVSSRAELHTLEVYKSQLTELARDQKRGLISDEEFENAKNEVNRRLLAVSEASEGSSISLRQSAGASYVVAMIATFAVPLGAILLYLSLGSPDRPDLPLSARSVPVESEPALPELIARAEKVLEGRPDDLNGWTLLAPIYMKLGRSNDAVKAYRNIVRLSPPSPQLDATLAEAIVIAGNNQVTDEAKSLFQAVLEKQPGSPRARYYLALWETQSGDPKRAASQWSDLIAASPPNAPWLKDAQGFRARSAEAAGIELAALPGNPTAEQIKDADTMSAEDRQEMISGMVASLADRLKDDPDNIEGWLRLIRSYQVLNRTDNAAKALETAIKQFKDRPDETGRLLALAGELGLNKGADQ
ncbi:MAG: c-type cytochrome biogenesis protein CcmI [Pseudomonadota bacterium]